MQHSGIQQSLAPTLAPRRRAFATRFAVLAAAVLACGLLGAQQPKAQSSAAGSPQFTPGQTPIIVHNVNEVNVVFTAVNTHDHDKFVTGLQQSQVQVFDDNHQQKITRFVTQGDVPLHIALLIDTSNSIRDRWDFEQQAAVDFLQSLLRPGSDKAMVIAFDSAPHTVVDFTDDINLISEGIHTLRPGGGTALYDALVYAAHDKMQPAGAGARDVIVIISDGADNQSRFSESEAVAIAQNAGAVIFTVSTEPMGSDTQDDAIMKHFAEETGGHSFFPVETRELPDAFDSIATELRNEYVVTYNPDDFVANGSFHPVQIKILIKDVQARARKGYTVPAAPAS